MSAYRDPEPSPPLPKAPPPREPFDRWWLVVLGVTAFTAAWGWSMAGEAGAIGLGLLALVIATLRTRRVAAWRRSRTIRQAMAFAAEVERDAGRVRVDATPAVRVDVEAGAADDAEGDDALEEEREGRAARR